MAMTRSEFLKQVRLIKEELEAADKNFKRRIGLLQSEKGGGNTETAVNDQIQIDRKNGIIRKW
ncbi:hypothetical protein [Methanocalculus natronophilus]|uniref:hypothetical protein n=1 Tax=Methanocalculus natronophilus TaxID=1262400 RepID=UPI0031B57F40